MEPGQYHATCTAVQPPRLYREYHRWYLRVDFAIHGDGSVVSKYLNLGTGNQPNGDLGPRSSFYKLWRAAVGRKPEHGEVMDPAKIVGIEFLVTVSDKALGGDGEAYSVVTAITREPVAQEALTLLCSDATGALSLECSSAEVLSRSTTQVHSSSLENPSGFPIEEIPPRGPERFRKHRSLLERDPDEARRFLEACNIKDAA